MTINGYKTTVLGNDLLKWTAGVNTRTLTWSTVNTPWMGLLAVLPTADDGTGAVEVVGTNYARINTVNRWLVTGKVLTNTVAINFPGSGTAGGTWTAAIGWGIWTASSGGTLLCWNTLTDPRTNTLGDVAQFAIGALVYRDY